MSQTSSFWVRHAALIFALRTFAAAMLALLNCALAGYAASLLGDGFGLYHLQPTGWRDSVESRLSVCWER